MYSPHGPDLQGRAEKTGKLGNMNPAPETNYAKAVELWKEWNAKINVISRKDTDAIYAHHILHSLAIAEFFSRFHGGDVPGTVLDLGTGGGFPGIPLAMEWPEAKFTLCDSVGRKVTVALAVAEGLGLENVECVQARAEELPGEWDYVVSRAVAPLETLYSWVKGKFRSGLVCLKGGDVNVEVSLLLRRFAKGPHALVPAQIRVWPISDWLHEDYFAEKFVIEVGKTYLCSPLRENDKKQA